MEEAMLCFLVSYENQMFYIHAGGSNLDQPDGVQLRV